MTYGLLGRWSALSVFLIGVLYAGALVVAFATHGAHEPVVDPLLAIMEGLTLISAPLMLVMVAAIHGRASRERRTVSTIALAFMILATGTTCAVHFVELTALRQLGTASLAWPSPAYALELLAWDLFLGLSLVFSGVSLGNSGRERRVARGLVLAGAMCLLGLLGPAIGNMRLQLVGVLGYGGVLPVVALMLATLFRDDLRVSDQTAVAETLRS